LTGFDDVAKSHLGRLAHLLGAKMADEFKNVDVLVCARAAGAKYALAQKNEIPVAGEAWLLATALTGRLRAPAEYPPLEVPTALMEASADSLVQQSRSGFSTSATLAALQSPAPPQARASCSDATRSIFGDATFFVTQRAEQEYPELIRQLQSHGRTRRRCEQETGAAAPQVLSFHSEPRFPLAFLSPASSHESGLSVKPKISSCVTHVLHIGGLNDGKDIRAVKKRDCPVLHPLWAVSLRTLRLPSFACISLAILALNTLPCILCRLRA
jgi:hypothetical protein